MNKLRFVNKMASVYRYATLLSNINHNLFIFILVSLILPMSERASAKIYGAQPIYDGDKRLTKEYHLRQGSIRGLIVQPGRQYELQSVEMFLGIPYAAPPVGNLRFMPPGSSLPWSGVKMATEFAPVCPQMLPNVNKENPPSSGRQQYMSRLLPFLKNESEDCLYLNVYVPNQERKPKKMPVLVFIHGDSFEWSSGNPYDGRILASYGNVMVVTINFRLGILGFMKPSLTEHVYGNQGLLDQLAALQWIKDNIGDLNGDPNSVTLMGHGTGAAAVNFLMISPISNGLFHRAILMSGSALSDWALTKNPMQYTVQVAQHLNCNISSRDIMSCLQSKRLSDIKKVQILARRFATPLGPVVAGSFIPNEPAQTIESYPNLFSKYELLSGVAELESYHDFGVIALAHGVLETERDEILAQYSQLQYDAAPEIAAKDILQEYSPMRIDPQRWGVNVNRDFVLDVLSDARTVAPLVMTANYHSKANPKSYFYVFGHNSEHTDYAALRKSVHGEEMPYVLGVPLGGAHTHFHEEYTAKERLLSEAVMRLWTNFVKGGTPNTQRVEQYLTLKSEDWKHYNIDWPEYNVEHQSFLHIDVAPSNFVRSFYRANYTKFWNEVLPNKMKNYAVSSLFEYESVSTTTSRPRKTFLSPGPVVRHNSRPPTPTFPHRPQIFAPAYGRHRHYVPTRPAPDPDEIYKEIKSIKTLSRPVQPELIEDTIRKLDLKPTIPTLPNTSTESPVKSSGATMGIIIAIGCIFLLVNIVIFATLYLKKRRLQARERELKRDTNSNGENVDVSDFYSKPKESTTFEKFKSGCSALKSINWNGISRTDEKHKKVKLESLKTPKSDDSGGFGQRFKLRRHLSSSTIDAHTKVRDWITNEIINRCSPPIQRKAKLNVELEGKDNLNRHKAFKSDETINQIRKPLTNSKDSLNISLHKETNSILSNNTSTTERPKTKTSEKTTSTSAQGSQSSISTYKKQSHKNRKISTSKSNDSIATSEGKSSNKVSVAIDANPVSINSAVLRQKPIELSKSLDIVEAISCKHEKDKNLLKRSKTENDFIDSETMVSSCADKNVIFMSVVNFPLNENIVQVTPLKSDVIKISHKHSISDPVKDINYDAIVKCTDFSDIPPPSTFRNEINVTSKDETDRVIPLTAAEALLTIQRRNFPKVLPDLPKSFENSHKRLSLQPNSFQSFRSYLNYDSSQKDNISPAKTPPQPPPRSSSTLDRRIGYKNSKSSATSSFDSGKISFGSTAEKILNKSDDYCNIDALSSIISEINKSTESNFRTSEIDRNVRSTLAQPVITREFPKVIIAADDIPKVNEPKIIIKPTLEKSSAEIQVNAPRVRLTDNFYGMGSESERSGSSLSMISDIECELEDEFEDDISDAELIEALVGSMDTTFDANDIPDTKGPDNCFENKLEIIPVKVNTTLKSPKNYENIKYCSENVLPDVSGLEKTAQIKQKFSLNKLQSRSESITQPPEKAVKLKDKKVSKTPVFHSHLSKDKTNIASISKLTKHKQDSKKKIPLEHSYSGSSNDTESSTGTVKKVEIKK